MSFARGELYTGTLRGFRYFDLICGELFSTNPRYHQYTPTDNVAVCKKFKVAKVIPGQIECCDATVNEYVDLSFVDYGNTDVTTLRSLVWHTQACPERPVDRNFLVAVMHPWEFVPESLDCGDREIRNLQYQLVEKHPNERISKDCSCGFYAFYEDTPPVDWGLSECPSLVAGVVEASGKIILGETGFRAERVDVVGLWVPIKPNFLCTSVSRETLDDLAFSRSNRLKEYAQLVAQRFSIYTTKDELLEKFPLRKPTEILNGE